MAYNTGNPVGSTDPRDLFDSAGNMDKLENGPEPFYPDRLGVQRLSRSGMIETYNNMIDGQSSQFDAAQAARVVEFGEFLTASAYIPMGNYAPGITLDKYNQYVAYGGYFYVPAPGSLPFTTSGTWEGADEDLFVLFSQDDALRQDLSSSDGAGMIGYSVSADYPGGSTGAEVRRVSEESAAAASELVELKSRKTHFSMPLTMIDESSVSGSTYKSEPRLVETNSGKILAFYRIGGAHADNTGRILYREFNRETKSWGVAKVLDDDASYDTRNQLAGCDPNTGRVFCFYSVREIPDSDIRATYYKYSEDEGVTWSARINLSQYCPYPAQLNIPYGKLIVFSGGKLMIPLYNYLTAFTLSSTDGGLTWGTTSASLPNPNPNVSTIYSGSIAAGNANLPEPTIVRINDSMLVAVCRCVPLGTETNGTATMQYIGTNWTASTTYLAGETVYLGGYFYIATTGGVSGATGPAHTSGSAVDGTVTWAYGGTPATWTASAEYTVNRTILAGGSRLYRATVAGVSGATAPTGTTFAGNETQFAYFRSADGGVTWSSVQKVTWTSSLKNVSVSPPSLVMIDEDTVGISWAGRYPDFNTYWVKVQARGFYANPWWAFSASSGEPKRRIWRAIPADSAVKTYDIHFGYIDLLPLTWATGVMAAWYDCPTLSANRADAYSTVINL